jgi:hypothetical protein
MSLDSSGRNPTTSDVVVTKEGILYEVENWMKTDDKIQLLEFD